MQLHDILMTFSGQESGFQSCTSLLSMNNNIQQQNSTFLQQQQHPTNVDHRLNQIQRSSLKDIYCGRKSRTLANGEDYSSAVLNNYSDPFSPKSHPENKYHSNVYGSSGLKSIKGVFKINSSQNSQNGSMTSLLSGLNSPLLGSTSSGYNYRNRRTNPIALSNLGTAIDPNNSDAEGHKIHYSRPDRFSLDINPSIKPFSNLIDGMSQAFNNSAERKLLNFTQQHVSPYMDTHFSNPSSQGMLKPLFFEVPQRDIIKNTNSVFVGR